MRNIWLLFRNDMKRLASNMVTGIMVLGLVLMPSIFSWYNILACWDVFGNTGNITVAVANTDEGYQSDLVPFKVGVGEQVVSALRANDQLKWTFTTEEDAVDGAKSGKYYAAVVIPPSFSKDMMTFYSNDMEHAQIVYYSNEKKSAVAPKVTDQGADQVSYEINKVFTETLSEVALGVSSSLSEYAESADADGAVGNLADHVSAMSAQMAQASSVLGAYASLMDSAQQMVGGSANLLAQAKDAASTVGSTAGEGKQAAATIADALAASAGALSDALSASSAGYGDVSDAVDAAFGSAGSLSADTAGQLRAQAAAADAQIAQFQAVIDQLQQLEQKVPSEYQPVVQLLIKQMNASLEQQQRLRDGLTQAADSVEAGNADAQAKHDEVKQLAEAAKQSVAGLSTSYETDIKPRMDQLVCEVSSLTQSLSCSAAKLGAAGDQLAGSAGSLSDQLGGAKQKLLDAAAELSASSSKLADLSQSVKEALASGDTEALKKVLGSDTAALATALAAPVQLDRHAVFPADNFGSQMAPLYTTLALWIGSLLLVVAVKVAVSKKAQAQLDNPRLHQLFLGRFGVFAVLSLMQTTVMGLGNMLFLGVQVNDPWLFMTCFWVSGLVFTFFIYSLVVSFANLGKAIAVFMLIIQVTSGGGSFPLQVLPQAFQALSPYLPATHVINAMRAAMMGAYQNEFWVQMGQLLLFLIPAALLGLVLRKPLMKFLNWYVEKVEDSKVVA